MNPPRVSGRGTAISSAMLNAPTHGRGAFLCGTAIAVRACVGLLETSFDNAMAVWYDRPVQPLGTDGAHTQGITPGPIIEHLPLRSRPRCVNCTITCALQRLSEQIFELKKSTDLNDKSFGIGGIGKFDGPVNWMRPGTDMFENTGKECVHRGN